MATASMANRKQQQSSQGQPQQPQQPQQQPQGQTGPKFKAAGNPQTNDRVENKYLRFWGGLRLIVERRGEGRI